MAEGDGTGPVSGAFVTTGVGIAASRVEAACRDPEALPATDIPAGALSQEFSATMDAAIIPNEQRSLFMEVWGVDLI